MTELLSFICVYRIALLLLGKIDIIEENHLTGDPRYYVTLRRIPPGHIYTEEEVNQIVNNFFYATPTPGFND